MNRPSPSASVCVIFYLLTTPFAFAAKPKKEDLRNELPAPFNLEATTLKNIITLAWKWPKPEQLPVFTEFGYEIKRGDGKTFRTAVTTYQDRNLSPGSYSYVVRVRGEAKEKGKRVAYVSDWSESAGGEIQLTCQRPPAVELTVESTQKYTTAIPSLRFHLKGQVSVDKGCTLTNPSYHLDTGTGITHSAPLDLDGKGRFELFVNAFGPDDEIPAGHVSIAFTASAEDEAGPATSTAYTIDVDLQNRFAPRQPD